MVARRVVLLVAQMIGHLGLQGSLQDGFGQFLEQSVLSDDILGFLVVGQQLIDQLLVDGHGIFILLFTWPFTQFYLHPHVVRCLSCKSDALMPLRNPSSSEPVGFVSQNYVSYELSESLSLPEFTFAFSLRRACSCSILASTL